MSVGYLKTYNITDEEHKTLIAAAWILHESHKLKNKPSDYFMNMVMYLLIYIRDNIFPTKKKKSIFTVILYAVVLFKHNYTRFYFLVLIVDGGIISGGDIPWRNTIRKYLRSVKTFYDNLPEHAKLPEGRYARFQGVTFTCKALLTKRAMKELQEADLGLDDILYLKAENTCISSTKMAETTIQIFNKIIEFGKLRQNQINKKHRQYDPQRSPAKFGLGVKRTSYSVAWIINVLVVLMGIFVSLDEWKHAGLSLKHDGYGGCGILSRIKVKPGTDAHALLKILNRIPCDVFIPWAKVWNVHARDYGIDLCFFAKFLKDIIAKIDPHSLKVKDMSLNPKGKVIPSHLNGSIASVLSDPSPWMDLSSAI